MKQAKCELCGAETDKLIQVQLGDITQVKFICEDCCDRAFYEEGQEAPAL